MIRGLIVELAVALLGEGDGEGGGHAFGVDAARFGNDDYDLRRRDDCYDIGDQSLR